MFTTTTVFGKDEVTDIRMRRQLRLRNHLLASPYWSSTRHVAAAFQHALWASVMKGAQAASQVAVPIVIVQVAMVSLVLSYFTIEPVREVFQQIVQFKLQVGPLFAFLSMGTIAIIAEGIRVVGDAGRRASFFSNAGFGFLVFGFLGVGTDFFYMLQNAIWAPLPDAMQVPAKVITDQFVWTVFIASPYQTLLYTLQDCRFSLERFLARTTPFREFYVREVLAVLVTNWAYWIPTTLILYCLPSSLQFVICQLAIVICIFLLTTLTKKS